MALDMNDLMALKGLENNGGMSPYEQVKIGHMQTRGRASGVGIAGLVLGCVGTVAGVTAWIFSPLYASSKAKEAKEAAQAAKEIAAVRGEATQRQLDQIAALLAAERTERISGDVTLNQTITDTVSGSQQGTLTAQQQAELTAMQSMANNALNDFVTGRASLNPTPVSLYSAPQPCACPASCGCGCGQ